jgi:hypothetical protein
MADPPETTSSQPPRAIQRVVTVLLILHFFAILTAVTASSDRDYPAPQVAVWANELLRPYLQSTLMNNGYRFFAPNPGSPTVLWFRVQYENRVVRWVEAPAPPGSLLRGAYQRRLNLAMQPSQYVVPVAGETGRYRLTNLGEIYLASYARHVARRHERLDAAGSPVPVRTVGIYFAQHASRTPAQVREGWKSTDLRTYKFIFAGAYCPDGQRVDEFSPFLKDQSISSVAAGILEVDLYPLLSGRGGTDTASLIDALSPPAPIRELLARSPELADPERSRGSAKQRIEELLGPP